MRAIVGRDRLDRAAASSSQMGRSETEWLVTDVNLETLTDLSGTWIEPGACAEVARRYHSRHGQLLSLVLSWSLLAGIALALLTGCYNKPFVPGCYDEPFGRPPGDAAKNIDFIIEIDDEGRFWYECVAEAALKKIKQESAKRNTIVVIFVHGWHNNASADSPNLQAFDESMGKLPTLLEEGLYADSRRELTGTEEVKVIGIYVAWRGRSLPGFLDYATFWDRKDAAEWVGSGDLRPFLRKLNEIYEARNLEGSQAGKQPFMGLAGFGHSFGGQVLFKATQPIFEKALKEAGATEQCGRSSSATALIKAEPLKGFGDMVVLVNPAFEAAQYKTIHRLSRSLEYDRRQPPLFLVLSAENDLPRLFWFKIARGLDLRISVPQDQRDQREMWRLALGVYEPQQTHAVELHQTHPVKPHEDQTHTVEPHEDRTTFNPQFYTDDPCEIVNYDLTKRPSLFISDEQPAVDDRDDEDLTGAELRPLEGRHKPYSPFLVATASKDVVDGHVGIWADDLTVFLTNYVALAEGKRLLLREGLDKGCPEPTP
jgi:hypothetical protein